MGTFGLLLVYFAILMIVSSDWSFVLEQFSLYWYFVIALAVGFGIQVGLYSYLKVAASGRVLAVSGTTSTAAMVSCCTHYLVNLLPVLGAVGFITLVAQYQVELFWLGLVFNFAGIIYMVSQIRKLGRSI